MKRTIKIGTRGSKLALWQANFTKTELEKLGHNVEIHIIKTKGDQIQHLSFDKIEGKGFFTKEIEEQLLNGAVDLAVHSHKDLETTQPDRLIITAVSQRANPSDILVIRNESFDQSKQFGLKKGAIVGTSSARRKNQLMSKRPDIELKDIRGNVPTRIEKLTTENFDAIMLAKAGVDRLEVNLDNYKVVVLDPKEFVPAPAQGVLGWQIREEDTWLAEIMQNLNCSDTRDRISIERKVLNLFNGGCQMPLGAYCEKLGDSFTLHTTVSDDWMKAPKSIVLVGNKETLAQDAVGLLKKKELESL